jgi:molybdopterin/thiamine biosynthesis adenylyltransferase
LPEDKLKTPITVIGAGGIGSITTLLLAKMGFENITVWDDDIVEDHNIPNQMYPLETIGVSKASAVYRECKRFAGLDIEVNQTKFDYSRVEGILVVTVDNMATRKAVFDKIKYSTNPSLLIDGRMGAENFMVYTIKPSSVEECSFYEKTLYEDSEAIQEPCTAKAIIYNTAFIGSIIASRIKNYLVGDPNKKEIIGDIKSLDLIMQ